MANIVELIIRGNDQSSKAIASSVKNLQGMDSALGAISRSLSGILSVGALVSLGKSAIDLGSQLDDASKKFGVSASELSALQYVAKLSGVEFEDLGGAFKFLSKSIAEAQDPSSDAAIAFKAMGISIRNSKGEIKGTDTLFMELADSFAGMEDGANKTALSLEIFGRAGSNILPVFADGAAGITKLKNEAKALGVTLSEEQIKKLDQYGDTIAKFGMGAKAAAGMLMVDMVEGIKSLWDGVEKYGPAIERFYARVFGGEVSSAPRDVVSGKIADILVPNPEPGKKKEAPNTAAIKKANDEKKKLLADYEKLHAANMAKEGAEVHETLAAEMGWTQEYHDTLRKLDDESFAEFKKGIEEQESLLEKFNRGQIQGLRDLQDAQRAESEDTETPMAAYGFEDAMKAAEAYGNVGLAIQTMNSDLGNTALILTENQSYISLYKQAWLDANLAVSESIASLYSGMQGWISSSIQGLITGTMKVQDVLKNLGKMMLSIIADYIAKWLVSRLFMAVMGKTFAAAEIATAVLTGGAVAKAWAPAAALVSLATIGGNAAAAVGALAGTVGFAQTLAIPMLAEGGIVNRPTLALIGEKGPEAVIPLGGGGGQGQTIVLQLDGDVLARWLHKASRTGVVRLVPA